MSKAIGYTRLSQEPDTSIDRQNHVRPLREFSDVEAANRPENLITLCASCHGQLEEKSLEEADLA